MYIPTHYYVRVSRAAIFTGTGPSSQALGLSSQALGLSSWVELPEVLDVPGVLDGHPVLRLQALRRVPGDAGHGTRPERLEHPTPPEVLPMKKGPVPVKKAWCL